MGYFSFYTVKCSSANEENILGVYGYHLLVGVLASSLRRYVHDRSFQQFQQTLLYTFTTYVAGYRRIVAFAGYLVYLVYEHYASLCCFHIVIRRLQQAGKYAFDIFAHIAGLGQHRSVYYGKRHMQQTGNSTRQ